jgi:bla regulator protein BlaR1
MILYLFKSTLCLLIFWGIYKLFLESEKLLSLVFSFAIPLVSIELPTETVESNLPLFQKAIEVQPAMLQAVKPITPTELPQTTSWWKYMILFSSLISLFFLILFLNNISTIIRTIQKNPIIKWEGAKLILLEKEILPYTFLNYIFIHKEHYQNARIEPELFSHELAHVRQKHSLDVILLELLRIVFWFNPLLYLFKQAIQLNHEFLADEAVNKTYRDVTAYQYLLLSKASQASGLSLTSNLNFQLTKKRLLMMTKITPQSTAFMKKAVCVPLFAALAFCLAEFQLIAQEPKTLKPTPPTVLQPSKPAKLTKEDVNYQNSLVLIREKDGSATRKNYSELTEEEKAKNIRVLYWKKIVPTKEEMENWKNPQMYGIWIDEKRVPNSAVSKYKPSDISSFSSSRVLKNATNYGKHKNQLDIMTNDYYENVYLKHVKESPTLFIDDNVKDEN